MPFDLYVGRPNQRHKLTLHGISLETATKYNIENCW